MQATTRMPLSRRSLSVFLISLSTHGNIIQRPCRSLHGIGCDRCAAFIGHNNAINTSAFCGANYSFEVSNIGKPVEHDEKGFERCRMLRNQILHGSKGNRRLYTIRPGDFLTEIRFRRSAGTDCTGTLCARATLKSSRTRSFASPTCTITLSMSLPARINCVTARVP